MASTTSPTRVAAVAMSWSSRVASPSSRIVVQANHHKQERQKSHHRRSSSSSSTSTIWHIRCCWRWGWQAFENIARVAVLPRGSCRNRRWKKREVHSVADDSCYGKAPERTVECGLALTYRRQTDSRKGSGTSGMLDHLKRKHMKEWLDVQNRSSSSATTKKKLGEIYHADE
ncbi:unnamed protein product [Ascophyllum nodosum]